MNKVIKKKYNPLVLIKRILIFTIPILVLFNLSYSLILKSQRESLIKEYTLAQGETVHIVSYVLQSIFRETYNDLMLIKNSNEFYDYLQNPDEQTFYEVEQMFMRVAQSKPHFDQIRLIDTEGREIVRVNNTKDGVELVPEDQLQDKKQRYYTSSAMNIPEGAMYISNLDLNVENNEVVVPYEIVMRFATPVYSGDAQKGILIVNYNGYELLSILNEYSDQNKNIAKIGIYDSKTLWEYEKSDTSDELILLQRDITDVFPSENFTISEDDESNYFVKDDEKYHIHLLDEIKDLNIVFENDYYRIGIVGRFSINEAIKQSNNIFLKDYSISWVLNFLIIVIAVIIIILIYQKKADSLMLMASQYISEDTHDSILIADRQKKIIYCNKVFEDTFGYDLASVKNKFLGDILSESIKIELTEEAGSYIWRGNIWETTKSGIHLLRHLKMRLIIEKKNNFAYYIGIYSEPKIDRIILDDSDLEKPSSSVFSKTVFNGLESAFNQGFEKNKQNLAIATKINELSGVKNNMSEHEANCFLSNIGKRLYLALGEDIVVISPGSDYLFIRVPFYKSHQNLENIMATLERVFNEIEFTGRPDIRLTYLSGIAISPNHGTTGIELLKNAFVALEAILKLRRSNYLVYNDSIYNLIKKDREIRHELKHAFQKNEFSVLYQVQKSADGQSIGTEALVRWKSEKLGIVSPAVFIPIMEESEYIKLLGLFVLKTVVQDFITIKNIIPDGFKISINLSSNEFMDESIVSSLVDMITDAGLPHENFCFEITETTLVNNLAHTNEIINYLHDQNIIVAIDDFGTGFSSLGYLKALYADKLKIDRAFIKDYPDTDDGTLIKAIISMAQQLKIGVIVEGIENQEQLDLITSAGCNNYQGYFGSKPIPFDEFTDRFLK